MWNKADLMPKMHVSHKVSIENCGKRWSHNHFHVLNLKEGKYRVMDLHFLKEVQSD